MTTDIKAMNGRLKDIVSSLAKLSSELDEAAGAAREGRFPVRSLAENINALLSEAAALAVLARSIVFPETEQNSAPPPATVEDLKHLVVDAAVRQSQIAERAVLRQVCMRIRNIRHVSEPNFSPLAVARKLAEQVDEAARSDLARASELVEPLPLLLQLLAETDLTKCRAIARKLDRALDGAEGAEKLIDAAWDKQLLEVEAVVSASQETATDYGEPTLGDHAAVPLSVTESTDPPSPTVRQASTAVAFVASKQESTAPVAVQSKATSLISNQARTDAASGASVSIQSEPSRRPLTALGSISGSTRSYKVPRPSVSPDAAAERPPQQSATAGEATTTTLNAGPDSATSVVTADENGPVTSSTFDGATIVSGKAAASPRDVSNSALADANRNDISNTGSDHTDSIDQVNGPLTPTAPLAPAGPPGIPTDARRRHGGLPSTLATFIAFRHAWRIGREGRLEQAPWGAETYPERLESVFLKTLSVQPPHFGRLWLLAAAAEQFPTVLPAPADIEVLAALWTGGHETIQAHSTPRRDEILAAYADSKLNASLRWRFSVFLEAVAPRTEAPLPAVRIDEVVDTLEFQNRDLATVTRELLRIGAAAEEPIARVRSLLGHDGNNVETLEQRMRSKRRELFDLFQRAQQRKLFRFKTDFCQELWHSFLREISVQIRMLFPQEDGGLPHPWNADQYSGFFGEAERRYREIMDRGGARLDDRAHMDRWAGRLLAEARAVDDLGRQLVVYKNRRNEIVAGVPVQLDSFRRLFSDRGGGERPDEALLRRLLARLLSAGQQGYPVEFLTSGDNGLCLTLNDACDAPGILACVPAPRGDVIRGGTIGRCTEVSSSRGVVACLLDEEEAEDAPRRATVEKLLEVVRSPAWRHLLPKLADLLPEAERIAAHQESLARVDAARSEAAAVKAKLWLLRDAVSPLAGPVEAACSDADALLDGPTEPDLALLLNEWLVAISREVDSELNAIKESLLREARNKGEQTRTSVDPLIQANRFAEALALLRGGGTPPAPRLRRTPFRFEAMSVYGHPLERLQVLRSEPAVSRWFDASAEHNQERSMRIEFCKLVLGKLYESAEKHHERTIIPTERIRRYLAEGQLNPSYVPQLARFGALVVPRIGMTATDAKYVQRAADVAAEHKDYGLVVVLAPRLSRERRDDLLTELRRRQLAAGIIDDLDLCRILNPGGERPNGVLALLEQVLEQQRWSAVSPFELVEGQHVHIEMYVGRAQEAEQLAKTARYSRLFSGRKLGKSALLRYVERQYDEKRLPSGLDLRVTYVSAVGIETAGALVDQIIEKLSERFALRIQNSGALSPFARLELALDVFFRTHQGQSLLVVLDEADVFVEREIEEYQTDYERCLSFQMRSRLEERRDSQGLPRVRFVFTGYRVTNTREGAWANWGDVLRLLPLPPGEAGDLIAGPLARLGIDASEQAPVIAHRCGYQPAVILRFGERILSRLEHRYPPDLRSRRRVVITPEDVAYTFEDEAVQQEIRTVAKNNFQGNPVGQVVFGVLLGEFLASGPASRLPHIEEALAQRLEALAGGKLEWLRPEGGSIRDELRRHIDDLVARQLLEEHRVPGQPSEYYLKFPHHLPVLAQLAREDILREEIGRLKNAGASVGAGPLASRGLLPRADLGELHDLVTRRDDLAPFCPVFGSAWDPENGALGRVFFRGLFDHLGLERGDVSSAGNALSRAQETFMSRERIAVVDVRAEDVDRLLAYRSPHRPLPLLVGGVDVVRECIKREERSASGEASVYMHVLGPGRLPRGAISWWFERARGFNFTDTNGILQIHAATGGVPLFVSVVDRLLLRSDPHGTGTEVTPSQLAAVIEEMEAARPRLVDALVQGASGIRLSRREAEILKMIAHVTRCETATQGEVQGQDLALAISEFWTSNYVERLPENSELSSATPVGTAYAAEDHVAVSVLLAVGLLPRDRSRSSGPPWEKIGAISREDVLLTLFPCHS